MYSVHYAYSSTWYDIAPGSVRSTTTTTYYIVQYKIVDSTVQ
jgi:hypothetical protein